MMLIEETTVPDEALPVDQFKAHLRMGTGFGEDSLQDDVLKGYLRAAMAAVEARTAKALLTRDFSLTLSSWWDRERQVLPVAPVASVTRVAIIDALDVATDVPTDRYRLENDTQRPQVRSIQTQFPPVPKGGAVRIEFSAGFAPDWQSLPADLAQAVLLLAAHYYEYRSETTLSDGCMPFGVTSLIQRYRPMRIGLGGVR